MADLLRDTGKTDEAVAAYRRSESLLAGLAGADPAAQAELALPAADRLAPEQGRPTRRRAGGMPAGAGGPGGAGRCPRSLE